MAKKAPFSIEIANLIQYNPFNYWAGFNMNSENHIVQCLQCERLKSSTGSWYMGEIDNIKGEISHTYCPDCVTVLQDRLLAARNFKQWDFERQIDYLKEDLSRHEKKFDRPSLKNYLEEFYCIESKNYSNYYAALQNELSNAICPICHHEVNAKSDQNIFGAHILHFQCFKEITNKIKIIVDNNWEQSDKFSAYLDLLKIEKAVRPALKDYLKKTRFDEPLKI